MMPPSWILCACASCSVLPSRYLPLDTPTSTWRGPRMRPRAPSLGTLLTAHLIRPATAQCSVCALRQPVPKERVLAHSACAARTRRRAPWAPAPLPAPHWCLLPCAPLGRQWRRPGASAALAPPPRRRRDSPPAAALPCRPMPSRWWAHGSMNSPPWTTARRARVLRGAVGAAGDALQQLSGGARSARGFTPPTQPPPSTPPRAQRRAQDLPPLSLPPVDRPRRVVLVRHGQSSWNAEGRLQGSSNESGLTEKGITQAHKTR